METPLIAHRCGRAYGPDSSRQALRAALAGGPLLGVETDVCLTRDGALACLHDAYLPVATTLTGWVHERRAADVLAGRLLDREGRATAERPLLVDELLDLVPPALTVQIDVKAHADPALARRTVDALAASSRRSLRRWQPTARCSTKRSRSGTRRSAARRIPISCCAKTSSSTSRAAG